MSIRSVLLGLVLGLVVASATYFNQAVLRQTDLIGNLLPVAVFGAAVVLMLVVSPLLGTLRLGEPLRAVELAVVVAVALAACGLPGSGFFRFFANNQAMPAHQVQTRSAWQAQEVMSYLPGGSPRLGEGHVTDWAELAGALHEPASPIAAQVASALPRSTRRELPEIASGRANDPEMRALLRRDLNRAIERNDLYEASAAESLDLPAEARALIEKRQDGRLRDHEQARLNRMLLAAALPEVILPMPEGRHALLLGGRRSDRVTDPLLTGTPEDTGWRAVPWDAWAPTIAVWGGLALLVAGASLCLVLVVHPQWTYHEQLVYPIARFVGELGRREADRRLPDVAHSKLFWYGFGAIALLHLVNGLHTWFDGVPEIPTTFSFTPLTELFPNASRVGGAHIAFAPTLYPAAIAFTFFLTSQVSLSLGLSQLAWMAFASTLLAGGFSLHEAAEGNATQMIQLGACLGVAAIVLYTGRRYYRDVACGMVGLNAGRVPGYSIWAARLMPVALVGAAALLHHIGMPWALGAGFLFLVMLMLVVITRLNAETGVFFVQIGYSPAVVLAAWLGMEAVGPTGFLLLALASVMLVSDQRQALMALLANGLWMVDRTSHATASPARPSRRIGGLTAVLVLMVILSFVAALVTTLGTQYDHGLNQHDWVAREMVPALPFDWTASRIADLSAMGELGPAVAAQGVERLAMVKLSGEVVFWTLFGLVLVLGCGLARLRLPWWPIHPVLFVVWGTFPSLTLWASFLLGWAVKTIVVRFGGAAGFHRLRPMMVGVIAAELLMGLMWIGVGATYYYFTEQSPPSYSVFP